MSASRIEMSNGAYFVVAQASSDTLDQIVNAPKAWVSMPLSDPGGLHPSAETARFLRDEVIAVWDIRPDQRFNR